MTACSTFVAFAAMASALASTGAGRKAVRLPPQVSRILFVRNLPYRITSEELFAVFGKYGPLRQVRIGSTPDTKGTAFVVYEEIQDAFHACSHLNGFGIGGRFLVVLYYQPTKKAAPGKDVLARTEQEVEALRSRVAAGDRIAEQQKESTRDDDLDDEKDKRWAKKA